jgi:hypothetical protein
VRLGGKRPVALWPLLKARKAVLVEPEHERTPSPQSPSITWQSAPSPM